MFDGPLGRQFCELGGGAGRAAAGENLVDGYGVGPVPVLDSPREPQQRDGVLAVVGLDMGGSGVVADGDVQIVVVAALPAPGP